MKEEILEELNIKEDHERECKLATGGLPESIWETYSSFANTNGGTILLGIREHRDSFTVEGLTDKQIVKYQKDFWSTLNDRNKVSKNILLNHHVRPMTIGDKEILRIDVPAADRHDKPVYIGTDPMKGTYKRDYEGDFLCTEEAVRAMFADQRDVSGDVEVLEVVKDSYFSKKLLFIVLGDDDAKYYKNIPQEGISADVYSALGQAKYSKYWSSVDKELEIEIEEIGDPMHAILQIKEKQIVQKILLDMPEFLEFIRDNKGLTLSEHIEKGFEDMISFMGL